MKKISQMCICLMMLMIIFLVRCASNQTDETYNKFISQLAEKQYYAFAELESIAYPVLLITDQVYEYEEGVQAAISCEVYYIKDGKIVAIGEISSEGTAYPVSCSDQGIYTAGHHYVEKYQVDEDLGILTSEENAEEVFEEGTGKETYFYTINGVKESVENRQKLEMLFEQYEKADMLNFQRWKR